MRPVLTFVGCLGMVLGTFWVTQGTGLVPIGLMAGDINWAYFGTALFIIALTAVADTRR